MRIKTMKTKLQGKVLIIVIIGVLLLVSVNATAYAIYYHSISVTATISEALSSTTETLDFSGVVGSSVKRTFVVNNAANNPLDTGVVWEEISKTSGVIYAIKYPSVYKLQSGENKISIVVYFDPGGELGSLTGKITLNRLKPLHTTD